MAPKDASDVVDFDIRSKTFFHWPQIEGKPGVAARRSGAAVLGGAWLCAPAAGRKIPVELPGRRALPAHTRQRHRMKTYRIATIPGDGIGKEVVPAGRQVLQALAAADGSFGFEFEDFGWGGDWYRAHGEGDRFFCCEFFVFREEDQAAAAVA